MTALKANTAMKRLLLLLALLIAGSAHADWFKSEIDKCVEAQLIQTCNEVSEYEGKRYRFYELIKKGGTESQCVEYWSKIKGGDIRKECLKAQSGNK